MKRVRAASPAAASSSKRVTRGAARAAAEGERQEEVVDVEESREDALSEIADNVVEPEYEDSGAESEGEGEEDEGEEGEEEEEEDWDDDDLEFAEEVEQSKPRSKGKGKAKEKEESQEKKKETQEEKLARIMKENPGLGEHKLRLGSHKDIEPIDFYDPKEFREFNGAPRRANLWGGRILRDEPRWPEEYKEARKNTYEGLKKILEGRKQQVAEKRDGGLIASSKAKTLKNCEDVDNLAQKIMSGQPNNTIGVLGLSKLTEERIADMSGFTIQMLKGRLVYEGVVFQDDEMIEKYEMKNSVDLYIGKSTARPGAGKRVLEGHEKSLRKARQGIADSHFLTCAFCQRAAIPRARAYIRPVWHEDRGESETQEGREAADSFTEFCEAVMSDFEQSLKMDGREILAKETGELLNSPGLEKLSQDVAPEHREAEHLGINKVC